MGRDDYANMYIYSASVVVQTLRWTRRYPSHPFPRQSSTYRHRGSNEISVWLSWVSSRVHVRLGFAGRSHRDCDLENEEYEIATILLHLKLRSVQKHLAGFPLSDVLFVGKRTKVEGERVGRAGGDRRWRRVWVVLAIGYAWFKDSTYHMVRISCLWVLFSPSCHRFSACTGFRFDEQAHRLLHLTSLETEI